MGLVCGIAHVEVRFCISTVGFDLVELSDNVMGLGDGQVVFGLGSLESMLVVRYGYVKLHYLGI